METSKPVTTPEDYRMDTTAVRSTPNKERGAESISPYSRPIDSGKLDSTALGGTSEVEVFNENTGGPSITQLTQMRRTDGQARALYRLLTLPIRSALHTATFVPADGGEEEAEFIDAVFNTPSESGGMTITFQKVMGHLLTSFFDGFAAFEKVFWVPETGPLKGKVTLKKLAPRPAETLTFVQSSNGGFRGIRQKMHTPDRGVIDKFIPADYVFYYATQEEERKFYGVSFFETAFFHYDKKVRLYFISHLAAQRAATGTKVGTVPKNASPAESQEFSRALSTSATAGWMKIPEGYKVDVLRDGGSFDFINMINHHNSQMSKSVLAAFFDANQGAGKNEGSLVNFAQPGDEMFILMLRAVMDDIADQINHYIIPQLIDMNFSSGKYPKFTWGSLTDEQRSAMSSVFDKIVSAGQSVNATPEFMRALEMHQADEMGLEIDYEAVDKREQEEKEQQQQAAAMEQEAAMQQNAVVPELEAEEIPEQDFDEGDTILRNGAPTESIDAVDEEDLDLPEDFSSDQLLDALDSFVGNLEEDDEDDDEEDDDMQLSSSESDVYSVAGDLLHFVKENIRG